MTISTDHRLVYEVPLELVSGSRFQPTGFPDIGAAVFRRPGSGGAETVRLVESAQSMANRLEAAGWDPVERRPRAALARLPWVEIRADDGEYLTSSRTEAHRLASAFLRRDLPGGRLGSHWQGAREAAAQASRRLPPRLRGPRTARRRT